MINIRKETERDHEAVYDLVTRAFAGAEHTDGDEQNLVVRLRKSAAFVPALSLVAEADGKLAGYALFTEVTVGDTVQLALAPLAVAPEYQKRGIGGALLREGHRIAKELGYGFSILLGHETYYPRFGYIPASRFGITAPFDVPEENFMALDLTGAGCPLNGTLTYAKEFFEH